MIPAEKWKWFGHAAHLIVARDCMFHLSTQIGNVIVSTVGNWQPVYLRKGDAMPPAQPIGCDRKYETMVFVVDGKCEDPSCGCEQPNHNGHNVDFDAYNEPGPATKGHWAMCVKWAELDGIAPKEEA